jgi:MerR family mercuric resistance operon transcriptional regulator
MAQDETLFIGELAEKAGVNRETLRYYERRGLLKPVRRTRSGYRVYGRESTERLLFIKRAQAFGFTLEEIRELLTLRPESSRSCDRVMGMLDRKLEELRQQIAEMRSFHKQLSRYRQSCSEALDEGESCPLIVEVSHTSKTAR